jgi:tRNA-specific 2-thiouridylase
MSKLEFKIVEIPEGSPVYDSQNKKEGLEGASRKFSYAVTDGKVVGKHQGAHYFTKGQRKGLAVGGTKEPLFILETDVEENVIYAGQGKEHPGLYRKGLFVKNAEVHWVRQDLSLKEGETMEVLARIRYRQPLEKASLHQTSHGLYVIFENEQMAIAEGQFVAWYKEDELLGSGVIS